MSQSSFTISEHNGFQIDFTPDNSFDTTLVAPEPLPGFSLSVTCDLSDDDWYVILVYLLIEAPWFRSWFVRKEQ